MMQLAPKREITVCAVIKERGREREREANKCKSHSSSTHTHIHMLMVETFVLIDLFAHVQSIGIILPDFVVGQKHARLKGKKKKKTASTNYTAHRRLWYLLTHKYIYICKQKKTN